MNLDEANKMYKGLETKNVLWNNDWGEIWDWNTATRIAKVYQIKHS
jgi:hypothetical protein